MKRWLVDNRWHLLLAVAAALFAGWLNIDAASAHPVGAGDYTWLWRAARELWAGHNPYRDPLLGTSHPYPFNAPLYYPLPAVLLVLPIAWLPVKLSATAFAVLSGGTLSFFASRRNMATWLMLLSPSFYLSMREGQLAPLMVALALVPGMALLGAAFKPNLGVALGLARPSLRAFIVSAGMGVLSLLILPTWPLDWLHNLGENRHTAPLQFGVIALPLLLAAFLWRKPNARLFLLLLIVPQRLIWYDQLPLHLIPRTLRQQFMMLGLSWAGYFFWEDLLLRRNSVVRPDDISGPVVIFCLFVPALCLMLWQERAMLPIPAFHRRKKPLTDTAH